MTDEEALNVLAVKLEKLEDKIIEQAEILKILSKSLNEYNGHIFIKSTKLQIKNDKRNYLKVKEWLENEKTKRA